MTNVPSIQDMLGQDLTFDQVISSLRLGRIQCLFARRSWDCGSVVYLATHTGTVWVPGEDPDTRNFMVVARHTVMKKDADGSVQEWVPTSVEMLAEDWFIKTVAENAEYIVDDLDGVEDGVDLEEFIRGFERLVADPPPIRSHNRLSNRITKNETCEDESGDDPMETPESAPSGTTMH